MDTTKKQLNRVVEKMILEHEGGTVFFDNLDRSVQQESYLLALVELARKVLVGYSDDFFEGEIIVVVSGKFGRYYNNFHRSRGGTDKIIVLNGGLRTGEPIDDVMQYLDIKNKDFVFLDDSFYSGKTRDIIKNELEKYGGKLIETFVVYDGSINKEKNVHSLYRYYNDKK